MGSRWGGGGLQRGRAPAGARDFVEDVGWDFRLPVVIECETCAGVDVGWEVLLPGDTFTDRRIISFVFPWHINLLLLSFLKGNSVSLATMAFVQTMMVMASTSAFWPS